jgi:hypothetical protein
MYKLVFFSHICSGTNLFEANIDGTFELTNRHNRVDAVSGVKYILFLIILACPIIFCILET